MHNLIIFSSAAQFSEVCSDAIGKDANTENKRHDELSQHLKISLCPSSLKTFKCVQTLCFFEAKPVSYLWNDSASSSIFFINRNVYSRPYQWQRRTTCYTPILISTFDTVRPHRYDFIYNCVAVEEVRSRAISTCWLLLYCGFDGFESTLNYLSSFPVLNFCVSARRQTLAILLV